MDNEASVQQLATAPSVEATTVEPAVIDSPTCRLPHDAACALFEILIAVMWSDGELLESEVVRGRAAADVLGLRPRGGGAFAAIASGPLPFPELGFEHLQPEQAAAVYAAAEWISVANDLPSKRRSRFLQALQTRMRIDPAQAARLRDLALTIDHDLDDPHHAFASLVDALDPESLS